MMWMTKASIILALALAATTGFPAGMTGRAQAAQETNAAKLATIESIHTVGEGDSTELVIKLSAPVTYTSYKTTAPLRLVVDLSQTTPGDIATPIAINKGNIKNVTVNRFDSDAGVLTRMNVELVNDSTSNISASQAQPGELRIAFTAPAASSVAGSIVDTATPRADEKSAEVPKIETTTPPPAADKAAEVPQQTPAAIPSVSEPIVPPAVAVTAETAAVTTPAPVVNPQVASDSEPLTRVLKAVSVKDDSIVLIIDGGLKEYKEFRLSKPERLVIDLFGVKSALPSRFLPLNAVGIASARVGLYPDKVRVVLDAVNGTFPEATAIKTEEGLLISLKQVSGEISAPKQVTPPSEKNADEIVVSKPKAVTEAAPVPKVAEAVAQAQTDEVPKAKLEKSSEPASVEMIDFQVIGGISRVAVQVKGDVTVEQPLKTPGFVTLTIKNAVLPKRLQRSLDAQAFVSPVLRVTPFIVKSRKRVDTKVRIAMRAAASFEFRREGDMVFVDFKNPEGMTAEKPVAVPQVSRPQIAKAAKPSAASDADITSELSPAPDSSAKPGITRIYKGRKVTLEFADAEVRKIFQLLSEVSNKNFVLGDDVGGTISIKLVNVPWDQALDIILDTKGLDKREDGNIIIIKGKGKFKSQAEEEQDIKKILTKSIELKNETFSINYADIATISGQLAGLKTDRGVITQDARTNKVIVKDIPQALEDMRKLVQQLDVAEKQVMIEARIVQADSNFARSIGVNWGVHFRDPSASFLGIRQLDTAFGGATATTAPLAGASPDPGGSLGISFGKLGSMVNVDMRLNAAASASLLKVISTPRVATLNNKTAKITQGQQIPYTSATSDKTETKFVAAALSLEVTPHINANGTISLKIDAKNDSPGPITAGSTTVPAINTKQATTELLLRDGETTVIGGIYVDSDNDADDGVPFLMDIPFLGKLFKSSAKTKTKNELLIFITPRILTTI